MRTGMQGPSGRVKRQQTAPEAGHVAAVSGSVGVAALEVPDRALVPWGAIIPP